MAEYIYIYIAKEKYNNIWKCHDCSINLHSYLHSTCLYYIDLLDMTQIGMATISVRIRAIHRRRVPCRLMLSLGSLSLTVHSNKRLPVKI